ncbi:MAG: FAD-dependent oxidoreductase [Cytophagales bacterium]|nr:MAG: FAD-dependent oxidoreductase [Cytophagales bacterium]TAF59972.1 MAG: FAD-dependent oxidoreductase [Cytophagales bacterium]
MTKIAILGAGAAGLRAGSLLKQKGYNVEILEASERVGGRVWSIKGFADFTVEAGACFVHGEHSSLYAWANNKNIPVSEVKGSFLYLYEQQLLSHRQLAQEAFFKDFLEFREGYSYYEAEDPREEISVQEFLHAHHVAPAHIPFYSALVGAYGALPEAISMKEMAQAAAAWDEGSKNFRCKTEFTEFLSVDIEVVRDCIHTQKVVRLVEQYAWGTRLVTDMGEIYEADAVIVTVPLTILQDNFISFQPPLSPAKVKAIQQLKMGKGRKIFLKFKQKFWDAQLAEITAGNVAQEYWVEGRGKNSQQAVLTAFILDRTERKEVLVEAMLSELSMAFKTDLRPLFEQALEIDWANMPFVKGLYSYPSPDSSKYRRALALPSHDRLFWAGEATEKYLFGTVQGAWASAERVVSEVQDVFKL